VPVIHQIFLCRAAHAVPRRAAPRRSKSSDDHVTAYIAIARADMIT
jgi:hypothetical protein